MDNFSIDKKGYEKNEVDNYIGELKIQYEKQLNEQSQVIADLKQQQSEMAEKLASCQKKEGQVSSALVFAVETAKEIESKSKDVFEVEIQRLKNLYNKWQSILTQIVALYPEVKGNSVVYKLFHDFESELVGILERENTISTNGNDFDNQKVYAKSLLQRIKGQNVPRLPNRVEVVKIRRLDQNMMDNNNVSTNQRNLYSNNFDNNNHLSNTKSEFEEFLNSEFESFDEFRSGTVQKVENKNKRFATDETSSTTFDLKEALTPEENLHDIMKIFDLDEAN